MGTGALTDTITATAMSDDATLLLTQWLSPAFPVGAFAYSHGLETAIVDGRVTTASDLQAWLEDICTQGAGRSDSVLLAAAHRGEVQQADAMARALAPSAERLQETILQGQALCETLNAVWSLDLPPLPYPVALGAAAARMDVPLDLTARMYLHAFLSNLTSSAVRLIPLGQTDGQRVLRALAPTIAKTAEAALDTPLDAITSASFAADIASMRHETLSTRIFRT